MLVKDTRRIIRKFKDVSVGSIIRFADDDDLAEFTYMVIVGCREENGDYDNLVCLDDGSLYYAKDEENIELLNAELIIKR